MRRRDPDITPARAPTLAECVGRAVSGVSRMYENRHEGQIILVCQTPPAVCCSDGPVWASRSSAQFATLISRTVRVRMFLPRFRTAFSVWLQMVSLPARQVGLVRPTQGVPASTRRRSSRAAFQKYLVSSSWVL